MEQLKKELLEIYKNDPNVVGAGIGDDCLYLYVKTDNLSGIKFHYKNVPVSVINTGEITAL